MLQDIPKEFKTNILELMVDCDYEHLNFFFDAETGLKSIISIHSTALGPALGGCRFYPYADEAAALKDVMRLSRAMTYKASIAGLDLGGGKSVIIGDPKRLKSPELMEAFGRCVERIGGRYITSVDSGTSAADMEDVKKGSSHVTGSLTGSGDPSPMTAIGVFEGIRAAVNFHFGSPDLTQKNIAVQGLGAVGMELCKLLHEAGAHLIVSDISEERIARAQDSFRADRRSIDEILRVECDVLAPCALGGVIDKDLVEKLATPIIAGAANNQLSQPEVGELLLNHNILFAPDYVINAGGLINVNQERLGYDRAKAEMKTRKIYDTLTSIFERSTQEKTSTSQVALDMANERLSAAKKV